MASFYYYDQNPFRFSFDILIWYSQWGFENKTPNLHKKAKSSRILVVVVKWRFIRKQPFLRIWETRLVLRVRIVRLHIVPFREQPILRREKNQ